MLWAAGLATGCGDRTSPATSGERAAGTRGVVFDSAEASLETAAAQADIAFIGVATRTFVDPLDDPRRFVAGRRMAEFSVKAWHLSPHGERPPSVPVWYGTELAADVAAEGSPNITTEPLPAREYLVLAVIRPISSTNRLVVAAIEGAGISEVAEGVTVRNGETTVPLDRLLSLLRARADR